MFITTSSAVLPLVRLLDQPPDLTTLLVIAAANAIVWVGLFCYLLWQLSRRSQQIDERIATLESKIQSDDQSTPVK